MRVKRDRVKGRPWFPVHEFEGAGAHVLATPERQLDEWITGPHVVLKGGEGGFQEVLRKRLEIALDQRGRVCIRTRPADNKGARVHRINALHEVLWCGCEDGGAGSGVHPIAEHEIAAGQRMSVVPGEVGP